ncbi:DUF2635 domain-containing protein [Pseudoduganella violaceinigra]|uniref:DUF2635 domain-containing protein n=1 Tax=Pseudoduganella violaceinigra TaxID=246602 RepID=UPI0009FDCA3E|nr:DUF2635 domain-containing protein [Pseudoduganella violaceinigra]
MRVINIVPVEGRLVRDPATGREIEGPTPVDGDDGFWIRRLSDGDVEEVAEAAESNAAKKGAKA